jgi:hypothetical protein
VVLGRESVLELCKGDNGMLETVGLSLHAWELFSGQQDNRYFLAVSLVIYYAVINPFNRAMQKV